MSKSYISFLTEIAASSVIKSKNDECCMSSIFMFMYSMQNCFVNFWFYHYISIFFLLSSNVRICEDVTSSKVLQINWRLKTVVKILQIIDECYKEPVTSWVRALFSTRMHYMHRVSAARRNSNLYLVGARIHSSSQVLWQYLFDF